MGQSHEVCAALEHSLTELTQFRFEVRRAQKGGLLFEVHGPINFYWNGIACCENRARVDAYEAYKRHLKAEQQKGLH